MATEMNPEMNLRTSAASQAVKMALPKEFSGKREELSQFIMSCLAHPLINWEIYDADEKKIGFLITLLNEEEAGLEGTIDSGLLQCCHKYQISNDFQNIQQFPPWP